MRQLLLAEATYRRLQKDLDSLPGLDFVTLSADGEVCLNGNVTVPDDLNLSILCLDTDLFQTGQFDFVDKLISQVGRFEFVQTVVAGMDHPFFRGVAEKAEVFCNSDAQAPAIAEFVVASVLNRWQRFDIRSDR